MDSVLIIINTLICLGGAWVCVQIRSGNFAASTALISGVTTMVVWMLLVRNAKMPLVTASAWYDVTQALGYFVGFMICGEHISSTQWLGILLLLIGLALVNFH